MRFRQRAVHRPPSRANAAKPNRNRPPALDGRLGGRETPLFSPGALVWIVPLLVAALGIWRPALGLMVLVASLPLFGSPPAGPYFGALDAAALAAVLAVLIRLRSTDRPAADPLTWPILAWISVSLVSMAPLVFQPPSWRPGTLVEIFRILGDAEAESPLYTWRATHDLLIGAALYWAGRRVLSERRLPGLGLAAAVGLSYVVVLGLGEYIGLVDLSGYRAVGDPQLDSRLHSLFFHSGWLAQFLVLATPLATAALVGRSARSRSAGWILAGAGLVAAVCTLQRGAWVAVGVQLLVVIGLVAPRVPRASRALRGVLLLCVLSVGAVAVIGATRPSLFRQLLRRSESAGESLSGRMRVWRASTRLLEGRELLGIGPGSFGLAFPKVNPAGERGPRWETAHSLYVNTLVEKGILGLVCLLVVVWTVARILFRSLARGRPRRPTMTAGLAVALLGIGVYGLVQHVFFIASIHWLCWILLAVVARIGGEAPMRSPSWIPRLLVVVTLLALPLRLATADPLDTPGNPNRAYGFHLPETGEGGETFRWTAERAAVRLPWEGETLVVELVDGHPRAGSRDLSVKIEVDGRLGWEGPVSGRWQEVTVRVGAPTKPWLLLEIVPSETFRPFRDLAGYTGFDSRDVRRLGVVVGRISWRDRTPAAGSGPRPTAGTSPR